jgi:hypothetical protein
MPRPIKPAAVASKRPCSHMDAYLPSHARNCSERAPKAAASQPGAVASKPAVSRRIFAAFLNDLHVIEGYDEESNQVIQTGEVIGGDIIKAVNSHAALVQALAHAEVLLSDQIDKAGFRTDMVEQYGKVLNMIRAARKLAGEEI